MVVATIEVVVLVDTTEVVDLAEVVETDLVTVHGQSVMVKVVGLVTV